MPPTIRSSSRRPVFQFPQHDQATWHVWIACAVVFLVLTGCVHYESQPLVLDKTAAVYESRSLQNEDLHRFLAQNLGREFATWPPAEWDFQTLAWVAFYYNPSLDVARAQWETAQAAIRTASARPNPNLVLTPGYNTSAGGGISPWFPALNIDFLLERANKRNLRVESARLGVESTRQAVFSAAWKVRSDLRKALLDLALADQRVSALNIQLQAQQRVVTLLDQRLRAGSIASNDVSVARLGLVRAEAAAADAARLAPLARQRVAQALGLPFAALTGAHLAAPPAPVPLNEGQLATARGEALQSRPDILGALARFDAAQSALALEIAKQRPDIHLGPGYQWDQGENKWSLALSFELPLFNHNEGPIAEAEARRREAAAQFLAAQAQALAEIDAAGAAQQAAAAQLEQLRRVQAELIRQQAAVAARLRAGGADQLEAQSAALEHATGELAVVEAQIQITAAAGQLEDALQIPFANLAGLASRARVQTSVSSP